MIKFEDLLSEFAENYLFNGDLLNNIKNIEQLNDDNVNKETLIKILRKSFGAHPNKKVTVGIQYIIYTRKERNQLIDYFINTTNFHIDALFVYKIENNKMIEGVTWKYKHAEEYLIKNLYLGYYFKLVPAIVSDNLLSKISFEKLWDLLIVASLSKGYHAAIVKDSSYDIVKELNFKNIVQAMTDNFVDPLSSMEIRSKIEKMEIEKLNKVYGSNVRTNRFMIYK